MIRDTFPCFLLVALILPLVVIPGTAAGIDGFRGALSASKPTGALLRGCELESINWAENAPKYAPYPTMAAAQGQENREQQTAEILVGAPGSDQTRYVPGSTVPSFSQFKFFRLGKIRLRPSAVISYVYESNLFAQSGTHYADSSYIIEPTIEAFVPVTSNGIRLDYTARFRDFRNYNLRNGWEHSVNADSQIDFSPILNLAVRDHFALSNLDSREFVPGREIIFSDARFRRNDLEARLSWSITDINTLGLSAGWNRVSFVERASDQTIPFYNYDQYRYGGYYRRAVSQRTGLFVDGDYHQSPTQDPRNISSSRGYEGVAGIETYITPLLSGQFSAGYRHDHYPKAYNQDFGGTVFRGVLQKEVSETIRLSLALSRATSPSNFQKNAYFLTQGVGLTYMQEVGPRLSFSVSPSYLRNSYPLFLEYDSDIPANLIGLEKRGDRLIDMGCNARYRYSEWVALDFRFDLTNRDSNIPDFRFNDYRLSASLLLGSRGITMGRFPY